MRRKQASRAVAARAGGSVLFLCTFAFVFLAGCSPRKAPTTRPAGTYDRQEAALKDPFGYSPDINADRPDISGGKLSEFDRKAMRKDLDHVLNP
ncbi:MAG TPA: hypothetical protein VER17_18995 [Tepidisphaeraceae bacterium]|nr:hypothetical protein [Tepidisphaeraceae bacterium]